MTIKEFLVKYGKQIELSKPDVGEKEVNQNNDLYFDESRESPYSTQNSGSRL